MEKSKVNSNSPSLQIYGRINFFFLFRFRVLCRQIGSLGTVRLGFPSLTGGTRFAQTPPVGRSENLTGHSFLFQWFSATKPSIFRLHYRPKKGEGKYYKLEKQVEYGYLGYLTGFSYYLQNTDF